MERVDITVKRLNHSEYAHLKDVEVDRESLGSTEHFGTRFVIFRAKKLM